jgi:type VI secretion system protein ImpA
MINIEDLIKPISADKPCGEDFSYHPSFLNLQTIAKGKPETQFSPAEEPQWKEVREAAIEVLSQSKHLEASVLLTVSLVKTGGVEGLRDGLAVVRGITENYWPDLYPKLDPDDNNDPRERLNILSNLSGNKFSLDLRQIVLCDSTALGRITLDQILAAKERAARTEDPDKPKGASSGPDLNQIQAAFRDGGPETAQATLALVNEAIGHADGIDSFLDKTLGAGQGVNFEALKKLLGEIKHAVEPYIPDAPAAASEEGQAAAAEPGAPARAVAMQGLAGTIQSRADVLKALDMICAYYDAKEKSSPVPLILQRAQRLVEKNFLEIVTDLTPDGLKQLQVITGTKSEE